jgi:hypothetical protein
LLDELNSSIISFIASDYIGNNISTIIGNNNLNFTNSANANTTLLNALTYTTLVTYPIVSILVNNGGGGYDTPPTLDIQSLLTVNNAQQNLTEFGILAPIQIINAGENYSANDMLTINGGDGDFAFARISSIGSGGAITGVEYYQNTNTPYALGGMGYKNSNLPIVNITSATGSNASLIIPSIMGTGAEYTLETDRIGAITKISLIGNGEDYISTPNVSLRIQDIVVSDISELNFTDGIIFQGEFETPTFFAYIDSITNIDKKSLDTPTDDIFAVRVYDYIGAVSYLSELKLYDKQKNITALTFESSYTNSTFKNGIKIYGDGSAKATAKFYDGLIFDEGRYINSDGQLSGHSVLQNDIYNSTTYIISAEKNYDSYKDVITNLVHPTGTRLVPKNLLKSNSQLSINTSSLIYQSNNSSGIELTLRNSNTIYSNTFYLSVESGWGDESWGDESWGTAASSNVATNTKIAIITTNNMNVYSTITAVDLLNDIITIENNIQYIFPNVFRGYSNSNTVIVVQENYPEDKYSINTFISINDTISIGNTTDKIINISNNILYLSNTQQYQFGNFDNLFNISIEKQLISNNIILYNVL